MRVSMSSTVKGTMDHQPSQGEQPNATHSKDSRASLFPSVRLWSKLLLYLTLFFPHFSLTQPEQCNPQSAGTSSTLKAFSQWQKVRYLHFKSIVHKLDVTRFIKFLICWDVGFFILDIFDIPRSEIASGEDDEQEHHSSTITETSYVTASAPPAPELPASPAPKATTPESSGAYIQEIHRETSLQESPVPSTPAETVKKEESVAHASGDSTSLTPESETANKPTSAHTPEILSAPAISSKSPSQPSLPSESKPSLDSPLVTNEQPPKIVRPQNNQAPQGTHVSQLVYLHQQQDILSKPTPKAVIAVAPGKVEAGSEFLKS